MPTELLELIFTDKEIMTCPIGTQSTILHALERIMFDNGFKIVKQDMDGQV